MSQLRKSLWAILPLIIIVALAYWIITTHHHKIDRSARVVEWIRNPHLHADWQVQAKQRCQHAPFIVPTAGYIGFLWDDSFYMGHRHQGIDIFSGTDVNTAPVYAAYPGYLTRLEDWVSSVIIRIPEDPLQAGRQIWIYYTHMAGPEGESYISEDFPAGSHEIPVQAGELLGYQGNYSGNPGRPVGVHLHFSIVLDDGNGRFLNELEIQNTLDPSPYLGMALNARQHRRRQRYFRDILPYLGMALNARQHSDLPPVCSQ